MVFECCYLPVFPNHTPSPHAHSFLVTWPVLLPALRPFVRKLHKSPIVGRPSAVSIYLLLNSVPFSFFCSPFHPHFFVSSHPTGIHAPREFTLFHLNLHSGLSRVLLRPLGWGREKRWSWLHIQDSGEFQMLWGGAVESRPLPRHSAANLHSRYLQLSNRKFHSNSSLRFRC